MMSSTCSWILTHFRTTLGLVQPSSLQMNKPRPHRPPPRPSPSSVTKLPLSSALTYFTAPLPRSVPCRSSGCTRSNFCRLFLFRGFYFSSPSFCDLISSVIMPTPPKSHLPDWASLLEDTSVTAGVLLSASRRGRTENEASALWMTLSYYHPRLVMLDLMLTLLARLTRANLISSSVTC